MVALLSYMLYSLPLLFGNWEYGQDDDYDDVNDDHYDDVHDRPSLLFCLLSLLASYCHGTNYLIKVMINTTIFIIFVTIMIFVIVI